jgi:Putative Ig domain
LFGMIYVSQKLLRSICIGVGKGVARMELIAFDPDSSTNGEPKTEWGVPEVQAWQPGDITRAVADLLQNKCLTHTFGVQREWEVRTTLVTRRRAWRYHSNVFVHGKEARKNFSPIDIDQTRQIRQAEAVTEEMVAAFAREAVEVHFARCASVAEYSLMASIFSQPPPRLQGITKVALVLFSVAVLLTAYWWWRQTNSLLLEQPEWMPSPHSVWRNINSMVFERLEWTPSSHSVRWQSLQVARHYPAGEPFVFALPALERIPEGLPIEMTLETSGDGPSWLELDRERLSIRGTAPVTAEDQTYRFSVRAHAEQGSDSRLFVLLTITGQPDRITPTPQLRGHWTW